MNSIATGKPSPSQSEALAMVALKYMEFQFSFTDGGILITNDRGQVAFAYLDSKHFDGVNAVATKGDRSTEAITHACQAVWHKTPQFSE